MIDYLKMRKNEQHFMLRFTEDQNFFSTGENKYLTRHDNAFKELNQVTGLLYNNKISDRLEIRPSIKKLNSHIDKYYQTFRRITSKIIEKGYQEHGLVGRMKREVETAYENNTNPYINEYILILRKHEKDYMLKNDPTYFEEFLNTYDGLQRYVKFDSLLKVSIDPNFTTQINNYKNYFAELVEINNEIGLTANEGLKNVMRKEIRQLDPELEKLSLLISVERKSVVRTNFITVYTFVTIVSLGLFIFIFSFSRSITKPLNKLKNYLTPLGKGILPEKKFRHKGRGEISQIGEAMNELIDGLRKTTLFAKDIGQGVYDGEFIPLSEEDTLGTSLIDMRKNLSVAKKEEKKRTVENERRKWSNEGLNKFSEILRNKSDDLKAVAYDVISNLVKYLNANQGGLFIYNDTNANDAYLELTASFAYDRNRYHNQRVELREGLTGTCALEKQTIYMTDLPNDYISISSGLGGATPECLLIVPLQVEGMLFGVVELASFNRLESYQIEFIERVSGSIASSLSVTKINNRTTRLLEEFRQQTEEMAAQEEEMRQNMEELQATQEEAARREAELQGQLNAITKANLVLELDLSGKILTVNDLYCEQLGYTQVELIGKNHQVLLSENDKDPLGIKEFWASLKRGVAKEGEFIRLHKQGEQVYIQGGYFPMLDALKQTYKVTFLGFDVTSKKQQAIELTKQAQVLAEQTEQMRSHEEFIMSNMGELESTQEELLKQEAEMNSLFEAINNTALVAELNTEGVIIQINSGLAELFSTNSEEAKGKNYTELSPDDVQSGLYGRMWIKLMEGENFANLRKIEHDEKTHWLSEYYSPISNSKGDVEKILYLAHDVTDSKQNEMELIELTEQMSLQEEFLRKNVEEMQESQEKLETKDKEVHERANKFKRKMEQLGLELEEKNAEIMMLNFRVDELKDTLGKLSDMDDEE